MKSTIIEGIPDSKIKRLKKHLLKAEELTGGKLRQKPREPANECPILNFAPLKIKGGGKCLYGIWRSYSWFGCRVFRLYTKEDSDWWADLKFETQEAITRHIQQWIKEGKKL